MKILFGVLLLCGMLCSVQGVANEYSPQLVHINHDFTMQIPRAWTRRSNLPVKGLAALFTPNMDMSVPNVSIFVVDATDIDAENFMRNSIANTPGAHVNQLGRKTLGNFTALVSDVTSSTQEMIKARHLFWHSQEVNTHTSRSIHYVIDDNNALLVIACSAVEEVHIRDCQLIMSTIKRAS